MLRFAIASAIELSASGQVPEWIMLFPIGVIAARDGRKFRIADKAAAQAVIDRTQAHQGGVDLFIDYDHQIVSTAKQDPGASAKAAGWIKTLETRDDGIYARVEWTPAAAKAIGDREWRYISPFFLTDKKDGGNVLEIINAALVNRPAFDMPALAAADLCPTNEESTMDIKALAAALGLPETATEEDVLKAMQAAAASTTALAAAIAAAGLPKTAKPEDLTAKIGEMAKAGEKSAAASAQEPDPNKFVPRTMFDALAEQVKSMQTSAATAAATQAVDAAIAAGKIAPAQKDWALKYATADAAGFAAFAAAAPVLTTATAASALPPAGTTAAAAGLSQEEASAAAMLGLPAEDYAKTKKGGK